VHPVHRWHLLPQQADALIGEAGSVQGVAAHVRLGGGVCRAPGEDPGQQTAAEPDLVGDVEPVRVHHDRGVDSLQGSVARQDLLAGVSLLGGRTEQHHPPGGRVA
jgi:hypothetical protein